MALFDENTTIEPAPRPRMSRRTLVGVWALAVAMVVLLVITFLPTSYVIQRPGPVYNTLGTAENADGEEVPLISVEGAETYPTEGSLDLLTVQVQGNREHTPSWFELAMAWFDPSRAVMPIDAIFPQDQTTKERNEESAQMMVDSQHEATAAALTELGYDVGATLSVYSVIDGAAAEGILEQGDLILTANGEDLTDVSTLRSVINEGEGAPVELLIERDGEQQTVEVTPKETTDDDGEKGWILGVNLTTDYDFPIDVTIQLNNVGGPSAGMMFALGIIDTLTPGRAQRRRADRRHGHDHRGRRGRADRGHPSEDVGRGGCRRPVVPRARGELRRGRGAHPRRLARVLGGGPRRRAGRARRGERGRRSRRAPDLHREMMRIVPETLRVS